MPVDPILPEQDAALRRFDGRCVVLSAPGAALLGALMRALSGRWASLAVVADEPGVMEELAGGGVSMIVVVEPDRWPGLKPLAMAIGQHFGEVLCMQFDAEPGGHGPHISALATRWMDRRGDPNVAGLAALEQAATRSRMDEPGDAPPEQQSPLGGEAAQPQPDDYTRETGETDPHRNGGMIVGPTEHTGGRRRKVQNLVVPAPKTKHNGNTLPEPLVTEEELSMLLGPPPAETA